MCKEKSAKHTHHLVKFQVKASPPTQKLYEFHEISGFILAITEILLKIKELNVSYFSEIPHKFNSTLNYIKNKKCPLSRLIAFSEMLTS